MFRFARNREVLWPVIISMPMDGGGVEESKANVRYKLLTQDELSDRAREEMEMLRDAEDIDKALSRISAEALEARRARLADQITGWEEVIDDASGNPLPFSRDTLMVLLRDPYIYAAFNRGLLDASRGAVAKN